MKTPTRLPYTVQRAELAAIVEPMARAGWGTAEIHAWFVTARRELAMQGDEPLSPREWLYAGGSQRRLVALVHADVTHARHDQEAARA